MPDVQGGRRNGREASTARAGSLFVTNIGKMLSLVLVGNETLFTPGKPDYAVLALAALFYLGAQSAENIALRVIDKFLGPNLFKEPDEKG